MSFRGIIFLLLMLGTAGCSSLIGDRQVRERILLSYLDQSERPALYYPGIFGRMTS